MNDLYLIAAAAIGSLVLTKLLFSKKGTEIAEKTKLTAVGGLTNNKKKDGNWEWDDGSIRSAIEKQCEKMDQEKADEQKQKVQK